jgi:hypothetical protein
MHHRRLRRRIARIILECRRDVRGNSGFADGGRSGCRSRRFRLHRLLAETDRIPFCDVLIVALAWKEGFPVSCRGFRIRLMAGSIRGFHGTIDVVVGHIQRKSTPIDEEIGLSLYSLRSLRGSSYS